MKPLLSIALLLAFALRLHADDWAATTLASIAQTEQQFDLAAARLDSTATRATNQSFNALVTAATQRATSLPEPQRSIFISKLQFLQRVHLLKLTTLSTFTLQSATDLSQRRDDYERDYRQWQSVRELQALEDLQWRGRR